MDDVQKRMIERYTKGEVPWDDVLPPPEIETLVKQLEPGRALDLGCGYGRTAIYLAQHGWEVDGVDFVAQAIAEARRRAQAANLEAPARFHVGSVTDLDFLEGPYDLAVDVGCGHSLGYDRLAAYRDELARLLRPGALFAFFARLREEGPETDEDGPRGVPEKWIVDLFGAGFTLLRSEIGRTEMEDDSSWASGWFWFQRT